MLDDVAVTCPVPSVTPGQSSTSTIFMTHLVQCARILSSIMQTLNPTRLVQYSSEDFLKCFQDLAQRLEDWRLSLPDFVQVGQRNPNANTPMGWNSHCIRLLQCSYNNLLLELNSVLSSPWMSKLLCPHPSPATQLQISKSWVLVAETARHVILSSNTGAINAASPSW